jgi:uncharacterized RDD family membrane protein YckC
METPQPPDQPDPDQPPSPPEPPPPPGGPEAPPSYGGPVPPGGWQQPIAQPRPGWVGRPPANWGVRLGAWFIDGLIVSVPATIVFFALFAGAIGLTGGDSDRGFGVLLGAAALTLLIFAVIALVYAPATMARQGPHNGQTWGKQMVGIRVVRDTGQPMDFWWAALREVGLKGIAVGVLSFIIPFLPWFLNYFWPLWDDQNRALHDMVASTHVVEA